MAFIDAVVESLTHLLFTCNKGRVYKLLRSVLQQQPSSLKHEQVSFLLGIKPADLKLDIQETDGLFAQQIKLSKDLFAVRDPRLLLLKLKQLTLSIAYQINSIRGKSDFIQQPDYDLIELLTM